MSGLWVRRSPEWGRSRLPREARALTLCLETAAHAATTPALGQFREQLLVYLVFVERGLSGLVLDTLPPLADSGSQLSLWVGGTSPRGHELRKAASQRPSLELVVPVHLDTLSADARDSPARPAPKPLPFGVGHSAGARAMNLKLANTENL